MKESEPDREDLMKTGGARLWCAPETWGSLRRHSQGSFCRCKGRDDNKPFGTGTRHGAQLALYF